MIFRLFPAVVLTRFLSANASPVAAQTVLKERLEKFRVLRKSPRHPAMFLNLVFLPTVVLDLGAKRFLRYRRKWRLQKSLLRD